MNPELPRQHGNLRAFSQVDPHSTNAVDETIAMSYAPDAVSDHWFSPASVAAIALGSRLIGCPLYFARIGESFPKPAMNGQRFISFVDDTDLKDNSGRVFGRLRAVALRDRPPLKEAERAIVGEVAAILTAEYEAGLAIGLIDDETRLPNRRSFLADLSAMPKADDGETRYVVVFTITGIQQYTEIMRALGHGFAESFAQSGARRIQQLLGATTKIYSINTLSFAFLLTGHGEIPIEKLEQIIAAFHQPVICRNIPVYVDASIGFSDLPSACATAESLRMAQSAAQDARMNCEPWVYSKLIPDDGRQRAQELIADLNRALSTDMQLHLVYQPRIDLKSGKIVAAEALIRWEHPTYGRIPPSEFIPLAEATALMTPLTQWILDAAIRQSAIWQAKGISIKLSVNISPANLRRADFADSLLQMLRTHGIPPRSLEIEITEDTAARAESTVIRQLEQCRDGGIAIAIDDFGTGFTNLAKLLGLPASLIKIDRSFIEKIDSDDRYKLRSSR